MRATVRIFVAHMAGCGRARAGCSRLDLQVELLATCLFQYSASAAVTAAYVGSWRLSFPLLGGIDDAERPGVSVGVVEVIADYLTSAPLQTYLLVLIL